MISSSQQGSWVHLSYPVFYYQKYLKYSTNRDTQQYQSIQKNINELFETANDYFIQGERERSRKEGILAEKNYRLAIKK